MLKSNSVNMDSYSIVNSLTFTNCCIIRLSTELVCPTCMAFIFIHNTDNINTYGFINFIRPEILMGKNSDIQSRLKA